MKNKSIVRRVPSHDRSCVNKCKISPTGIKPFMGWAQHSKKACFYFYGNKIYEE